MSSDTAVKKQSKTENVHFTRSTFLVLSGYSGTGKTTIREFILSKIPGSHFSLSVTTRKPRTDEKNGVDYQFVSRKRFEEMRDNGEFLEWEEVHGNYYGTLLQPVAEIQKKPGLLIFDVDVFGGLSIKRRFDEAILVFLKPPSLEILKERLRSRHTDSPEEIEKRLQRIPEEEAVSSDYDYIIRNISAEQAADDICIIIRKFQQR